MILRKLLASSPYAITGTLQTILERLHKKLNGDDLSDNDLSDEKLVARLIEQEEIEDEYLDVEDELLEYESNGQDTQTDAVNHNGRDEAEELQAEIAEIESFIQQAQSLTTDTKAEALLTALDLGFAKMAEHNGPRKAIIFTESKRTQQFCQTISQVMAIKAKSSPSAAQIPALKPTKFTNSGCSNIRVVTVLRAPRKSTSALL